MTNSSEKYTANRVGNMLQTGMIIASMAGLFGVLGWLIFGETGLIFAVVFAVVLSVSTPKISPPVVMRMYKAYKFSNSEAHGLHEIISELAERAQLPTVPQLYYVPTRVMNAFSVGSRQDSAIALSDGLIRNLTWREITGVLAHEVSHIANNDLRLHTLANIMTKITSTLSFFGQVLILFYLPIAIFSEARISFAFILLLIFAPTVSMLLQLALSRTREFDADLTAARLTGDPMGLATALKRMDTKQRSLWDMLFIPGRKVSQYPSVLRTHPHTRERVDKLMSMAPEEPRPSSRRGHDDLFVPPDHYTRVDRPSRRQWFRQFY